MAYCRTTETCHVYMYQTVGGWQFYLSKDTEDDQQDFLVKDAKLALQKLKSLHAQGFGVPQHAIDRLSEEIQNDER